MLAQVLGSPAGSAGWRHCRRLLAGLEDWPAQTKTEVQQQPHEEHSPANRGLYGVHISLRSLVILGGCAVVGFRVQHAPRYTWSPQ